MGYGESQREGERESRGGGERKIDKGSDLQKDNIEHHIDREHQKNKSRIQWMYFGVYFYMEPCVLYHWFHVS